MAPGLALRGVGPAGSGVQRPRVKTFEADPGLVLGLFGTFLYMGSFKGSFKGSLRVL